MRLPRFDAVLFDLDDTLYDQAKPFAGGVREVLGNRLYGVDADAIYQSSRRHSGEVYKAYNDGARPTEDIYIRRMRGVAADFGITVSDEEALRMQRAYVMHGSRYMVLDPAMAACLELCRLHVPRGTGIVTNGTHATQLGKFKILGLGLWIEGRHLFVSQDVKAAKPSPRIFQRACLQMGAIPTSCLFVGDSYMSDIVGAHDAGMKTVWLDRRRTPIHDGMNPDLANYVVRTDESLLVLMRTLLR